MPVLLTAVLIEAAFLWISGIGGNIVPSIVLLLLAHAAYVLAVYLVLQHETVRNGAARSLIIPAAVVFRITLAPLQAPSTDDLYRYRWEAQVQHAGGNPYEARPESPEWQQIRDSTFQRVPSRDFKAGYGPAWEHLSHWTLDIISRWTSLPERQVFWLKVPAAFFDLLTIAALRLLLRVKEHPPERILIYAWAPLPVWEFWANGHNDAVLVFFMVCALVLAVRGKVWLGAAALGVSIAVKWWPALLIPAYAKRYGYLPAVLGPLVMVVVFALPFATDITENAQFLSGFVGGWRNNDSLFGLLLWITGDLYRAKYIAFGIIGAVTLWIAAKAWPIEYASLWTITVLLVVSANVHPWYLTWFVPFLVFLPHPALLLWVSLAPLFYEVRIAWELLGEWNGSTPSRWLVYAPVFGVFIWEALRRRQTKQIHEAAQLDR